MLLAVEETTRETADHDIIGPPRSAPSPHSMDDREKSEEISKVVFEEASS